MRRIEIDEEVYEALAQHVKGFEQPNDVLRRLLHLKAEEEVPAPSLPAGYKAGKLKTLMDAGLIKPGDGLVHHQPRRGNTYTAIIEPDGWIRTEVKRYQSPSPALVDLVGSSIDGWANWTHVPSGKSLRTLRGNLSGGGGLRAV